MSTTLNKSDRNVLPIWRSFRQTAQSNELSIDGTLRTSKESDFDLSKLQKDFNDSPSLFVATDYYSALITSNNRDEYLLSEVREFITNHPHATSTQKLFLFDEHEQYNSIDKLVEVASHSDFFTILDVRTAIRALKRLLSIYPRDVTMYVDLSRLYTILGQSRAAEQTILNAIKLNHRNRFVLRSAARMFVHFGDYDKGSYYIKKSGLLKTDPWLYATYSGLEGLNGKRRINTALINKFEASNKFSDLSLTELRSAMATYEVQNGNLKSGRKWFRSSLKSPNSNSLAQVEWASNKFHLFDVEPDQYEVTHKFEALAYDSYAKSDYQRAYEQGLNWYFDVPYSSDPILFTSHVASYFLGEYGKAEELLIMGLSHNPNNVTIINNLTYCMAKQDKIDESLALLTRLLAVNLKDVNYFTSSCILATIGLVFIKTGQISEGIEFYNKSRTVAENHGDENLGIISQLHLAEALPLEHEVRIRIMNEFKEPQGSDWRDEINAVRDRLVREIKL